MIAIVDDDATFRESVANVLRAHGYRAASFASAAEFLAAPERAVTSCLILDVHMPGVSGPELARLLHAGHAEPPVIFASSLDEADAKALAHDSGAVAFLQKPYREAELLHAIALAIAIARTTEQGEAHMATITTKDGTHIFYKDWGKGRPIVFSHGWPLTADAWDDQMVFFAARGFRCIAHDRRGHGRSSQPWDGNEMNTYADDLATLTQTLDLKDAIHVGHSTGGGEVVRYLGRHGTKRASKAVLIGAVPPLMLKTEANPGGLPIEAFDGIRAGVLADRSQFFKDLSLPFYGYNRPGAQASQGVRDSFWLQGMLAGHKSALDCIQAFSETDFTADLTKIDVPTLILHGDDDQIVPIGASALLTAKLVKGSTLKVYPGIGHGLCTVNKDVVNADMLAFFEG